MKSLPVLLWWTDVASYSIDTSVSEAVMSRFQHGSEYLITLVQQAYDAQMNFTKTRPLPLPYNMLNHIDTISMIMPKGAIV